MTTAAQGHRTATRGVVVTCLAFAVSATQLSTIPYEYSCVDASTKTYPFCNVSLPVLERARAFVGALDLGNLTDRMKSYGTPDIPELNVSGECV
jgi:hypothetical protein